VHAANVPYGKPQASQGAGAAPAPGGRLCQCGGEAVLLTSNSSNNPGRQFYKCPKPNRVRGL
jgi:hypothetical protein